MPTKSKKEIGILLDGTDEKKLLELAQLNKSKKYEYTFKDTLIKLNDEEMDTLWENLCQMIMKNYENISENNNDSNSQSPKKLYTDVGNITQAVIDLALVILSESMPVPKGFLHLVVFLNGILLSIPSVLDNIMNNIASLCEKMFYLNYTDHGELLAYNTVVYLLRRSTSPKAAKKDVKRTYALRTLIPKIITMENVDSNEVWELLKKCVVSHLYSTTLEGQKIITLALITDIDRVSEVHKVIKKKLYTCSLTQATTYGKAYFEAWSHTFKTGCSSYKNEIEMTCIQDLILTGVLEKSKTILLSVQKVLAQFHCKKKEIDVQRMLYSLYHPILWLYLKNPDGLIRANSAKLFLDVFPLENPDLDVVSTDLELNDQMMMIKELLLDDYPIVRCCTIIGVCLAMSVNWELFPEDMLKTYFKILTDDLSCDSSSSDVRCAVAKGFKVLLENPLTVPTLQTILPNLKNLFDDISNLVRIAFCQLLLSVKKVWGIKYFDIVPLDHLLARMEEDPAVSKLIVNLIHNSYFPKNEHPKNWLIRCIEMIKTNSESSREFFRHIPRYIGIEAAAKFMVQAVKAIHFYTSKKSAENNSSRANSAKKSNKKKRKSLNESGDVEALEAAVGFHDPNIVMGLLDAVSILYLSSNLTKPEHKHHFKMVVGNLSKWMEDLVLYYENTPVWPSVFYLASLLPPESVPSLARLCHDLLSSACNQLDDEECTTILHCLCNQREGGNLLSTLKDWIDTEFSQSKSSRPSTKTSRYSIQTPTPKRRKISKCASINANASLALKMLNELLDNMPCQKILLMQHAKELSSFLNLYGELKLKIESFLEVNISEEEVSFISNLLLALSKIAVLLQDENCNGIKLVEEVINWIQDKLFKKIKHQGNATPGVTRRSSILPQSKCSADFEKLVIDLSKDMCVILADITSLDYLNQKKSKFVKFGIQLLDLDCGASALLQVSRLLLAHIWSGSLLYLTKKQENLLQIVPDCFSKINKCTSDANVISTLPNDTLKEIQRNLTESLKLLKKCYGSSFRLSCPISLLAVEPSKTSTGKENQLVNETLTNSEPLLASETSKD